MGARSIFSEKNRRRSLRLALRRAQRLGSVNRNAFSRDVAGYLSDEVAGRIVDIAKVKEPLCVLPP